MSGYGRRLAAWAGNMQVAYVPHAIRMLGLSVGTVGLTLATFGAGMIVGALAAPHIVAAMPFGRAIRVEPAVSVPVAAGFVVQAALIFGSRVRTLQALPMAAG
jgi:hypothetical protein